MTFVWMLIGLGALMNGDHATAACFFLIGILFLER